MTDWQNDFNYYYFECGVLNSAPLADVPEEIEDYAKISDAVAFVQKCGAVGWSQHTPRNEYHELCLEILKVAVKLYGTKYKTLYRGVRSSRPDSDHKIMFATPSKTVAEWYGDVKEISNIKGLAYRSTLNSVIECSSEPDIEILFFPAT